MSQQLSHINIKNIAPREKYIDKRLFKIRYADKQAITFYILKYIKIILF
jgi:hypothetical protein